MGDSLSYLDNLLVVISSVLTSIKNSRLLGLSRATSIPRWPAHR